MSDKNMKNWVQLK